MWSKTIFNRFCKGLFHPPKNKNGHHLLIPICHSKRFLYQLLFYIFILYFHFILFLILNVSFSHFIMFLLFIIFCSISIQLN